MPHSEVGKLVRMATFHLNLSPSDGGLKMSEFLMNRARADAIVPVAGRGGTLPLNTAESEAKGKAGHRLVLTAQILVVVVLTFLVISLLYLSYRVNSSAEWAVAAAAPYMTQLRDHGMQMAANADAASFSMAHAMAETDGLASASIPALLQTLNETIETVHGLQESLRHPSVHMTLD